VLKLGTVHQRVYTGIQVATKTQYFKKEKTNGKKIGNMQAHVRDNSGHHTDTLLSTLIAAFSPFRSLTEGVDGYTLAQNMIEWVNAIHEEDQIFSCGIELLKIKLESETKQSAKIMLKRFEVRLKTPTSGTLISLKRYAKKYLVVVDFGSNGSSSRATAIRKTAERLGVRFDTIIALR